MATTTKKTTTPAKTATPAKTTTPVKVVATTAKAPNDPSNKYNTATGKLNPNYNGGSGSSSFAPTSSKKSSSSVGIRTTAPAKTTGYSVAPKNTVVATTNTTPNAINSSKSNVVTYKAPAAVNTPTFANPFSGGFLNNLKGGLGIAQTAAKREANVVAGNVSLAASNLAANAMSGIRDTSNIANSYYVPFPGQAAKDAAASKAAPAVISQGGSPLTNFASKVNNSVASSPVAANKPKNMSIATGGYVDSNGVSHIPNQSSAQNMSVNPNTTGAESPTSTTKTTAENPDGSTSVTTTSAPIVNPTSYSPDVATNTKGIMQVRSDSISKASADPFNKYNKANEIIKYNDTTLTNIAKQFNTPQQSIDEYNNNPEFRQQVDQLTQQTGKTINDIASKVTTVTNGITAPQTTAEYLAGGPASLGGIKNAINQQISDEAKYIDNQKKLVYDGLEKDKQDAKSMVDLLTQQENNRETSERQKAKLAIDKAQAEYDAADAEAEQNRILAKDNLTNFLAKIGALSTDGAAGVGLANLEAKYQAQRAALRSNFQLAKRTIEIDMNDHINGLEEARDEKVFKLNQDLSKSERDITVEVLRLNHDLQKETSDAKLKYAEMIKTEKDKAQAKAKAASSSWEQAFFDTAVTAKYFNSLPEAFKNSWQANNSPAANPQSRTTLAGDKGLAADYAAWSKNQNNAFKMTTAEEYKLQQQGVDTSAYKTDPEYRDYVNSQLSE